MYTVMREKFDDFLGQKAKERGAEILTNEKVIDVQMLAGTQNPPTSGGFWVPGDSPDQR